MCSGTSSVRNRQSQEPTACLCRLFLDPSALLLSMWASEGFQCTLNYWSRIGCSEGRNVRWAENSTKDGILTQSDLGPALPRPQLTVCAISPLSWNVSSWRTCPDTSVKCTARTDLDIYSIVCFVSFFPTVLIEHLL